MRLVNDANADGKRVLVRFDFNEPLAQGKLTSSLRIDAALPTLAVLHRAKTIRCLAHLGRPEGKVVAGLRLKPIAVKLRKLLRLSGQPKLTSTPFGPAYKIHDQIELLENIRFRKEEEGLSKTFGKALASHHDLYVNDAFSAHHPAVSTTLITEYLPAVYGLRFAEEVTELRRLRARPEQPFIVIIGGAKIEDKLGVVEALSDAADQVLIGGAAAKIARDKRLFHDQKNVYLTEDGPGFAQGREQDIGPLTIFRFERAIDGAKTIFWGGPLGQVENARYQAGTRTVAQAILESQARSVVGGGDTLAFLERINRLKDFTFYSLGGGAMLEFLAKGTLPTIEALEENEQRFPKI